VIFAIRHLLNVLNAAGGDYMPEAWLRGKEQCFLLKIRGDSMQGANIEDGNYVLI